MEKEQCYEGRDEEFDAWILDEDKVRTERGSSSSRRRRRLRWWACQLLMLSLSPPWQLLDVMEPMMAEGGNVVDYHSCDFFPERWFDLVLVMRADNTTLYDRLTAR